MKSLSSHSRRASVPPIASSSTPPCVASSQFGMQSSMITPGGHVAMNWRTAVPCPSPPPAVEAPRQQAWRQTCECKYRKCARWIRLLPPSPCSSIGRRRRRAQGECVGAAQGPRTSLRCRVRARRHGFADGLGVGTERGAAGLPERYEQRAAASVAGVGHAAAAVLARLVTALGVYVFGPLLYRR